MGGGNEMHAATSRAARLPIVFLIGLFLLKGHSVLLGVQETIPENVSLLLAGAPSLGDPAARIAIVEFGDYQCPYCGQHANQVLPEILRDYVNTGKVRYFFKDTPVESIHPQALKASEAALCSGDQGKYWEMHDRLFKNQQALTENDLPSHARALQLDVPRFQECLNNGTHTGQIRNGIQEVMKFGVRGTPTFFVGTLVLSESAKAPIRLSGAKPFRAFQQVLDELLASQGSDVPRK
jgi:protein-disulfide isomerase